MDTLETHLIDRKVQDSNDWISYPHFSPNPSIIHELFTISNNKITSCRYTGGRVYQTRDGPTVG